MALILNIDTSTEGASICIAKDGEPMVSAENLLQREHASWLHMAIKKLLGDNNLQLKQLQAVAISIGPGSYTGLRIGLSTAKGLCYALQIPIIALGTLEIMANAVEHQGADLLAPMIDARRMEVYTALYDNSMIELLGPRAMVINEDSFKEYLKEQKVLFFGNGSKKLQTVLNHENSIFTLMEIKAENMADLAEKAFQKKLFSDLAYVEPQYLKDFSTSSHNK